MGHYDDCYDREDPALTARRKVALDHLNEMLDSLACKFTPRDLMLLMKPDSYFGEYHKPQIERIEKLYKVFKDRS